MQNIRRIKLADALAWLELSYSSLKLDAFAIFAAIALTIVLMCAGAYQEAVRQASLFLAVTPQQDATLMQVTNLINQYGLGLLVAICYFSNVSGQGRRRELVIDALCIALGVLLPQIVFHVSWLYIAREIINTYGLTVGPAVVNTINLEWQIVWGLSLLIGLVALQARRLELPSKGSNRSAKSHSTM